MVSLDTARVVIFDFDETLFTLQLPWEFFTQPLYVECLRRDPTLAQFKYQTISDLHNEAVRRLGEDMRQWILKLTAEFERDQLKGVTENHDLTDWIRQQSDGKRICLWTSNLFATVVPILTKAGLIRHFAQIITKDSVQFLKPDPEGFYHIFDPMTDDRSDFLFVGDSVNDQKAAAEAGIAFQKYDAKAVVQN